MNTDYSPKSGRYEEMIYRRCGRSGLNLPVISLGLWHNFGELTPHAIKREMCFAAFDNGITHFDLANNYGPHQVVQKKLLVKFFVKIFLDTEMS